MQYISIAVLFTPLFYIYPEMVIPTLASAGAAVSAAGLSRNDFWPTLVKIAYFAAGTACCVLLCLPFWQGTIGTMVAQSIFATRSSVTWYEFFQLYIFSSAMTEPNYSGLYALFAWPVDALTGVFGLYFIRPPADLSRITQIEWKSGIYIPLTIAVTGLARISWQSFRARPDKPAAFFVRFSFFTTLVGVALCGMGQYWTAGKLLAEYGVAFIFLFSILPNKRSVFWSLYAAVVLIYVSLNVKFGVDRVISSLFDKGIAHDSLAYPARYSSGLKASVEWDTAPALKAASGCREIALDIDQPFLDHYVQTALTVQNQPWTSIRPINDYYGLVPNRGNLQRVPSDCTLATSSSGADGKIALQLSRSAMSFDVDRQMDRPIDREIGVSQPAGVDVLGVYPVELFQGQLLRWTKGDAEFRVADWGDGRPGRLTVRLWGISPAGQTPFTVTANGVAIGAGFVTNKLVEQTMEIPSLPKGGTLDIKLTSTTMSPPGDQRTLGVAVKSLNLVK